MSVFHEMCFILCMHTFSGENGPLDALVRHWIFCFCCEIFCRINSPGLIKYCWGSRSGISTFAKTMKREFSLFVLLRSLISLFPPSASLCVFNKGRLRKARGIYYELSKFLENTVIGQVQKVAPLWEALLVYFIPNFLNPALLI